MSDAFVKASVNTIIPNALRIDAYKAVQDAVAARSEVDVSAIAKQVQARNLLYNVALEDIESLVLSIAGQLHAPVYFSGLSLESPCGPKPNE